MAKIKIDSGKCKGCCLCVSECPRGNIRMSEIFNKSGHSFAEIIDIEDCTGCALCCQMCPDIAIQIEDKNRASKIPIKESSQHESNKELMKKLE
jgi:2-oxoglutarate ferredoxin oxidoreductase subunit delta